MFLAEKMILDDAVQTLEIDRNNDSFPYLQFELIIKNFRKILKQTIKLLKISNTLQKDLKNTQNNVKNLFDNSKQGFLSFSSDLLIKQDYSAECRKILEQDIDDKRFGDIIFLIMKKTVNTLTIQQNIYF
jgi:two-component system chemotaxis sensor kinase CheA